MAHHRCTRCKQESETRYKYKRSGVAGVYCLDCLRYMRGEGIYEIRRSVFGWFGSIWDRITDFVGWVTAPFTHTHKVALKDKAATVKLAYSVAMNKARDIPGNAQAGVPQKQ